MAVTNVPAPQVQLPLPDRVTASSSCLRFPSIICRCGTANCTGATGKFLSTLRSRRRPSDGLFVSARTLREPSDAGQSRYAIRGFPSVCLDDASADFSLGTTFADVKSLKWNSGRSSLQASGRISDFSDPRLDGSYDAHVDLAEAAAIARRHDLREGVAELKGNGHWSLERFHRLRRVVATARPGLAGRSVRDSRRRARLPTTR